MYTIEASRCIAACVPFQTKEVADPPARAGVPAGFSGKRARETSSNECQVRGHGCGVIALKAIEQHITAEQNDCRQAIHKVGRSSGPVFAHFAGSYLGKPTAQLFVAVFESSASTPAAHALANE
jgi:hypothetical protein